MTTYRTFRILVSFDRIDFARHFEILATDIEVAMNDIREAYGECRLVQYQTV